MDFKIPKVRNITKEDQNNYQYTQNRGDVTDRLTAAELRLYYKNRMLRDKSIPEEERHVLLQKMRTDDGSLKDVFSVYMYSDVWHYICHPCKINGMVWEIFTEHIQSKDHEEKVKFPGKSEENFDVTIVEDIFGKVLRASESNNQERVVNNGIHERTVNFDKPLVGLEYVIETFNYSLNNPEKFICLLCDVEHGFEHFMTHLTSDEHYWKFLTKFFPTAEKKLRDLKDTGTITHSQQDKLVRHLVGRIEYIYGRLRPLRVDYWLYREIKHIVFQLIETKTRHIREITVQNFSECVRLNHLDPNYCPVGWLRRKSDHVELRNIEIPKNFDAHYFCLKPDENREMDHNTLQRHVLYELKNTNNVSKRNDAARKWLKEISFNRSRCPGRRFHCVDDSSSKIRKEDRTNAYGSIKEANGIVNSKDKNSQSTSSPSVRESTASHPPEVELLSKQQKKRRKRNERLRAKMQEYIELKNSSLDRTKDKDRVFGMENMAFLNNSSSGSKIVPTSFQEASLIGDKSVTKRWSEVKISKIVGFCLPQFKNYRDPQNVKPQLVDQNVKKQPQKMPRDKSAKSRLQHASIQNINELGARFVLSLSVQDRIKEARLINLRNEGPGQRQRRNIPGSNLSLYQTQPSSYAVNPFVFGTRVGGKGQATSVPSNHVPYQPSKSHLSGNFTVQNRSDNEQRKYETLQQNQEIIRSPYQTQKEFIPNLKRDCSFSVQDDNDLLAKRSKISSAGPVMQNVTTHNTTTDIKVIPVLRQILVLENYLGSLGSEVIDLLSEALSLEKSSEGSADFLVTREEILLETVKEKLTGLVELGLLDKGENVIASSLIRKIDSLVNSSRRMSTPSELKNFSPFEKPKSDEGIEQINSFINPREGLISSSERTSLSYPEKPTSSEDCSTLYTRNMFQLSKQNLLRIIDDQIIKLE